MGQRTLAESADALDAGARLGGVEVRGARAGERETPVRLQRGVDETERVARVDALGRGIVDDEVVIGVSRGVVDAEGGVAELERLTVLERADALLGNRIDRPVELREPLRSVHGGRALDELGRIDEVARRAGMREQRRVPGTPPRAHSRQRHDRGGHG